jgi:hypothetical protein
MKTDTHEQAIAKAVQLRDLPVGWPSVGIFAADATQMLFFTQSGEVWCEATLYRRDTAAGDQDLKTGLGRLVQRFPMSAALPTDLLPLVQLVQAYLHNHAAEQAGAL